MSEQKDGPMAAETVGLISHPEPGITQITLNRPEVRNAIGWESWRALATTLVDINADDDCRAVVLTGAGGAFCAGGDIKSAPSTGKGLGAPAARLLMAQRMLHDLLTLPKPVVAAVEGAAMGVGWSMALCCDLIVASNTAVFGAPFVLRGLVPDGGAAWFLTRALGRHRAGSLLLTGGRMTAPQAAQEGLVTTLTEPGAALAAATEQAVRMAAGAPEATRLTKGMIRAAQDLSLERFLEVEWLSATLDITGPDAAEGRAAFGEKRDPDFSTLRTTP